MADYNLVKGHDIKIAGVPKNTVVEGETPEFVALKPSEFRGIKPKLMVEEEHFFITVVQMRPGMEAILNLGQAMQRFFIWVIFYCLMQ